MSDISALGGLSSSYLDNLTTQATTKNTADGVTSKVSGLSSQSTKEELEAAAKSFESYFVEQILKEMKESVDDVNQDSDASLSQYTDFYMDSTIQTLAEELVEEFGGNFTDSMVEQMARNYGINLEESDTTQS